MSNYLSEAKRPNGEEFEQVEIIDDYFGSHIYGVRFPNGEVLPEEECELKSNIKDENTRTY